MKPINDNVFIARFEMEKEVGGINVSEKACVKNHIGVCRYAENDKIVGSTVHIPHYGVQDIEFDGKEYAMAKEERLFAILEDGEWKPYGAYVRIRKCENDHVRDESGEIALYVTKNHIETTNWVEIMDIGDGCKMMGREYIGMFCFCPENDERLARIGNTKDFCLHEDLIKFVTTGD